MAACRLRCNNVVGNAAVTHHVGELAMCRLLGRCVTCHVTYNGCKPSIGEHCAWPPHVCVVWSFFLCRRVLSVVWLDVGSVGVGVTIVWRRGFATATVRRLYKSPFSAGHK